MSACKYCGTPYRPVDGGYYTQCNCKNRELANWEVAQKLAHLKSQIPPYEVYQVIRLFCQLDNGGVEPELTISKQAVVSHEEFQKGLQWMLANNPQREE